MVLRVGGYSVEGTYSRQYDVSCRADLTVSGTLFKFSRTTFPRTDSRRTETHTNVTLLLKYFQFRTSCLVESRHKTNFAWDAKCKLIKS